jgi:chemotaxis response regulator CheB
VAAPARVVATMTVALLGRDDSARASLRRALEDLGAQVVFEGDPATLQADQVLRSGPQVVIVNLASGVEDDIDHLQPLFDHPKVNVLFNEAEVSSQLEGWDLARWARHLASKVLGHERTIPPPPPGAELLPMRNFMPSPGAPPTPAQMTIERPIEEFMIEAEDRADDVPSNHLPYAQAQRKPAPQEEPATEFRIDVSEVEGALAQIGDAPAVEQIAVPEPEVPEIVVREGEAAEFDAGLDLAALDAALEMEKAPPPKSAGKSDAELLDEALSGLDLSLEPEPAPPPQAARARAPTPTLTLEDVAAPESDEVALLGGGELGLSDLDVELESMAQSSEETIEFDAGDDGVSIGSVSLSDDGLGLDDGNAGFLDDDVAALAAQLDALDASAPRGEVKDLDFIDVSDLDAPAPAPAPAPKPPAPRPGATVATPAAGKPADAPAKKVSFGELDLTPLDDEPAAAPATTAKSEASYDFSGLNFSLEPTEEELQELARAAAQQEMAAARAAAASGQATPAAAPASAPAPVSATSDLDALFAAMDLAPAKANVPHPNTGEISRVIVLGASIGGPDALRTFLAGIPEHFPALFLLAQHLENAFFERLAQQLQKSSKLPVRVPEAGKRALAGEVLVVPAGQRVQVAPNGEITMQGYASTPKYTPCIDDVMRDAADQYGANATAIIFSGMAGDAIEGSVYLTSQGGEVWAQDPSSCVVSSMVDGARARGVVEFVGSPRELAEHCVAKYGRG